MIVTPWVKRALAFRREERALTKAGFRRHETDWELHRGGMQHCVILEARISVCRKYVYTKIGKPGDSCVYGQRAICGMAHRISFELYNAEIPAGLLALHICDNRPCVNPNHIVLGTNKANMYDMKRKHRAAAGERHHASRLTMEQAHRIREAAQTFDYATHGHIAKQFGVSRSTVTKILSGKAYKAGG